MRTVEQRGKDLEDPTTPPRAPSHPRVAVGARFIPRRAAPSVPAPPPSGILLPLLIFFGSRGCCVLGGILTQRSRRRLLAAAHYFSGRQNLVKRGANLL